MKRCCLVFAIVFALVDCGLAQEYLDYASVFSTAQDRTTSDIPKDERIYVLGPEQSTEIYLNNGREERRQFLYLRVYNRKEIRTIEQLFLKKLRLNNGVQFRVILFRKTSKTPILKLSGQLSDICLSQFPLEGEDILIIQSGKG